MVRCEPHNVSSPIDASALECRMWLVEATYQRGRRTTMHRYTGAGYMMNPCCHPIAAISVADPGRRHAQSPCLAHTGANHGSRACEIQRRYCANVPYYVSNTQLVQGVGFCAQRRPLSCRLDASRPHRASGHAVRREAVASWPWWALALRLECSASRYAWVLR